MQGVSKKSDVVPENTYKKKKLNKKWEIAISLVATVVVAILSKYLANDFEMAVFSLITFIACQVFFTWYNSVDIMPEIDERMYGLETVIKGHAQECKDTKTKVHLFITLAKNFGLVSDKYSDQNNMDSSFVAKLYKAKLDKIEVALGNVKGGKDFEFDTDIFRRFSQIVFDTPIVDNVDYFYSTAYCGDPFYWFTSKEGEAYLLHIDDNVIARENAPHNPKIHNKRKIKRIFIYKGTIRDITIKDWIFIQLHINSEYQVKLMNDRTYETKLAEQDTKNAFGLYRKNFMWQKPADKEKTGKMSVNPDTIKEFTKIFNDLWDAPECIDLPKMAPEIQEHCNDRPITDLFNVIEEAKRNWKDI